METEGDRTMTNGIEEPSRVPLTEDEEKALALYDRLQELRLEIAIINAQRKHQPDEPSSPTEEETHKAQSDLLDARARYVLTNNVVEAVLMANPILKAVHNGTDASPVERDLLPYIERRDNAAISAAKQAAGSGRLWDEMTTAQSETLRVSRRNVRLTSELLALAEEVRSKKMGRDDEPETRRELWRLEQDVKTSRQRWRIMKAVAAGIVVGSGTDWATDEELCNIVLDPETDE